MTLSRPSWIFSIALVSIVFFIAIVLLTRSPQPSATDISPGITPSSTIGIEVIEAFEESDAVSVVVMLTEPPTMKRGNADPIVIRREIARLQDEVLATLAPSEFLLSTRYTNVPAFAGRLFPAGLEKLGADPRIVRVDLDTGGIGGSGAAAKTHEENLK